MTSDATIDAGTRLAERYDLRGRLGVGGAGDVWLAHDESLERKVAVKVLRKSSAEDLQRFDAEIRAQAPLTHPCIVRVFDAGSHEGIPFIVMAYVDGDPLSDVLSGGPLPADRVAAVGRQMADALAHAHSQGVVHRDVKPGNVLLDERGDAYLTDFGIARLDDSAHLTATGAFVGSAAYVAPEQVSDEAVSAASDVYALGLVLLEALTGRQEYTGAPIEAAVARLHREPHVPADLPPPWPALLGAMVAREPARRPDAAEVSRRLAGEPPSDAQAGRATAEHATAEHATTAALDRSAPEPSDESEEYEEPVRRAARPRWPWAVAAAVAALVAVVALLALPDDPPEGTAPAEPSSLEEALDRLEETIEP